MTKEEMKEKYASEFRYWIDRLGSFPMEQIAHADFSESYEVDVVHVLLLEDGKYALIIEHGCSCYEVSDADIELFPTKEAVMDKFNKYVSENKR